MDNRFPSHWASFEMLDVIDYEGGSQPPKKDFVYENKPSYVRLIQIRDYGDNPFPTYVPESKKLKHTDEDDIMIARYGGSAGNDSLGRICSGIKGAYNVALTKVIYPKAILPGSFVRYLLNGPWLKERLNSLSRSCQSGFNRDDLKDLVLPLPPPNEQKRIIEKLDSILPKVKSAKARLEKIPGTLKKFRQSVLAAACSGRLTEDWREGKGLIKDNVSFENTEKQRLKNYNIRINKAKAEGERKPKKPANLNDKLYLEGIDNFEELPANWLYIPLAKATGNVVDCLVDGPFGSAINVKKDYIETGVTVVRINNIRPFRFVADNFKYVSNEKYDELKRHNIEPNDVLLVKVGATIGDCCIYNLDHVSLLSTTGSCRIRVDFEITSPGFICIVLNRYKKYLQETSSEMAQPFLNMDRIKNLPIPFPPPEEQNEIVHRVKKLFALADSLEAKYKKAISRVDKIEQSVLAKAFRGELVEPDPNDEPAEELLKRILEEKVKIEKQSKTKKRGYHHAS